MSVLPFLLFLLSSTLSADPPDTPTSTWTETTTLTFFVQTEELPVYSDSARVTVCLKTKVLTNPDTAYSTEFTELTTALEQLKGSKLFKDLPDNVGIKAALSDIDTILANAGTLKGWVADMKNFQGPSQSFPADVVCDKEIPGPNNNIYGLLAQVSGRAADFWTAVKTQIEAATSTELQTKLAGSVPYGTNNLVERFEDVFAAFRDVYILNELLLQRKISESLTIHLDLKLTALVEGMQPETVTVDSCSEGTEGLLCVIHVNPLAVVGKAFRFQPVPFHFEGSVYELALPGSLIDPTLSFISLSCQREGRGCTKVTWETDACLNSLNKLDLQDIGQTCRFKSVVPEDYFLLGTSSGSVVVGPTLDPDLVAFANDKRLLDFPVEICGVGEVQVRKDDKKETVKLTCSSGTINSFVFNESSLAIIMSSHGGFELEDLLPDNVQDILTLSSILLHITTVTFMVVACLWRMGLCGNRPPHEPSRRRRAFDRIYERLSGRNRACPSAPQADFELREIPSQGAANELKAAACARNRDRL